MSHPELARLKAKIREQGMRTGRVPFDWLLPILEDHDALERLRIHAPKEPVKHERSGEV